MPDKTRTPPQVSLAAFLRPIEAITDFIPGNVSALIDRLFQASQARQVKTAYRFMGLMDGQHGTEDLWRLQLPAQRKDALRELLLRHFAPILPEIERRDATLLSVKQAFENVFGITGTSVDRAVSFFIYAAQYTGIELPPQLERISGKTKMRRQPAEIPPPEEWHPPKLGPDYLGPYHFGAPIPDVSPAESSPKNTFTRSIRLHSGGSVTIAMNVDLFTLDSEDRTFILDLIDRIRRYEPTFGADDFSR